MPQQPPAALEKIHAFSPNRETLGGTSYLIVENSGNILVDCPPWNEETQQVLAQSGPVRWWVLTHRAGFGKLETVRQLQASLGCELLVQEQEAYLLPRVELTPFGDRHALSPFARLLWTPGHSPGSSCLWCNLHGGTLFSGRHLLPVPGGDLLPQKTAKTFHWLRQLASVAALRQEFSAATLAIVCPGASVGFLRGRTWVDRAYARLEALDLEAARHNPAAMRSPAE